MGEPAGSYYLHIISTHQTVNKCWEFGNWKPLGDCKVSHGKLIYYYYSK